MAKKIFDSFNGTLPRLAVPSRGLPDRDPVNRLVVLVPGRLAWEVVGPRAGQPSQVESGQGQRQAGKAATNETVTDQAQ